MLLNKGLEVPEVGRRVGMLANTLRKAIRDGRPIHKIKEKPAGSTNVNAVSLGILA